MSSHSEELSFSDLFCFKLASSKAFFLLFLRTLKVLKINSSSETFWLDNFYFSAFAFSAFFYFFPVPFLFFFPPLPFPSPPSSLPFPSPPSLPSPSLSFPFLLVYSIISLHSLFIPVSTATSHPVYSMHYGLLLPTTKSVAL